MTTDGFHPSVVSCALSTGIVISGSIESANRLCADYIITWLCNSGVGFVMLRRVSDYAHELVINEYIE